MLNRAKSTVKNTIKRIIKMQIKGLPKAIIYTFALELIFLCVFYGIGLVAKAIHITLIDVDFPNTLAIIKVFGEVNFITGICLVAAGLNDSDHDGTIDALEHKDSLDKPKRGGEINGQHEA